MRILILWASELNPNLGVRALARGSRDLLATVWPDAEFTFADFGQRPATIPWGSPRALLRERITGRLGMQEYFRTFDLIWDTRSGDSFADIYGLRRHTVMSLVHEFARQAGTPVVMAPQTFGPFTTTRGRLLARRNLRRSARVFSRDPASEASARRLGRRVDATVTDLVFGINQPVPADAHDVVLNVSGLLWNSNSHVDHRAYRSAVREVIEGLLANGRRVTLLPHVLDSGDHDNDVPTARELLAEFDGRIDLVVPEELDDARALIASANVVIGARMHACLNALSTGVPAIAMAYSRKFEPLMRSIEWPYVVELSGGPDVAAAVLTLVADPSLTERARASRGRAQELLGRAVLLLRSGVS
ncbi:MAG TPA: polysaccharide pyruvyl transferase family protein [Pseudolysinimonas sp.]|nr:polysaccharide pyruvyl transferase family protein [Pseudolysinimonas sp.]